MEIAYITDKTLLPEPDGADRSGLVAVGGKLTTERLLESYSKGIFPWYSEGEPVLWWSPDPRTILIPDKLHISRSMNKLIRKRSFHVTMNRDFPTVIENCGKSRKKTEGTWITREIKKAYIQLHREGFAHSVEVWQGGEISGGLYGLSFNRMFFGESMFSLKSNASKYGLIALTGHIKQMGFRFIDCQTASSHLDTLGAEAISRSEFLGMVRNELSGGQITKSLFPEILEP